MERRGRISKQLLDNPTKMRGYSKLREEALDSVVWGNGFGIIL
jgi:hypothetical protein